ncbi:FbpB family small basic protein [Oceanobacillus halotolerans]|uniref:FbpB family small basic protein n=1 Tax=Oceanobacillus halotolerans TaxID=2663380 RepID=UPI0013D8FF83|nr:FbpB family small basic protein [Oceanobacillus halotolerans]
MRQKFQTFEDLVNENKEQLLQDEHQLDKIELRIEKRQTEQQVTDSKEWTH